MTSATGHTIRVRLVDIGSGSGPTALYCLLAKVGRATLLSKLESFRSVEMLFRAWWTEPFDHHAQVDYFTSRGLLFLVQLFIGTCCLLLASIPVLLLFTPTGPQTVPARAVSLAFAAVALVWAWMWWFQPWPRRYWSIAFVVFADVGIAVVSLMDSNRIAGLFGLASFVLVSVYVQFFEGPKILALHTGWILAVIAVFATMIGTGPDADPFLALSKAIAATAAIAVPPTVIHFGIWAMRGDASQSTTDALTGALNRRGLQVLVDGRLHIGGGHDARSELVAIMIDLDDFKRVNDTHGHAAGDDVLVRCTRRIEQAVRSSALVARTGGEEFAVVDIASADDAISMAEEVRRAIADSTGGIPVTASVGVATIALTGVSRRDATAVVSAAIERADRAMFEAKRNGGNAVRCVEEER